MPKKEPENVPETPVPQTDISQLHELAPHEDSGQQRGQFRQYRTNLIYKQIQTEFLVSLVLTVCVCAVFWELAPIRVLLGWASIVNLMVVVRSIFIYKRADDDRPDVIVARGVFYISTVVISGLCWGGLSAITLKYGGAGMEPFALVILSCISLTAYVSMQSSPQAIAGFVVPALSPMVALSFREYGAISISQGIIVLIITGLMISSSRILQNILANNIRELKNIRDSLFKEKENAQVTLDSIGDGVIRTNPEGYIEYMNAAAEKAVGCSSAEGYGKSLMEVFNIVDDKTLKMPPDPAKLSAEEGRSVMLPGYLQLIHPNHNKRMSIEVLATPIRDSSEKITGVVVVFHDVSELRSLSTMTYHATHDSLTGLINRREFERHISQALENARNSNGRYVLCYMDLDNFKLVNDTSGHIAGDALLKMLKPRFQSVLREADSLARIGGDEFGILLAGCSVDWASEVTEKIRAMVEDFRFVWDDKAFRIGVSIGIVTIGADSGVLSDVLSAADSACYMAKEKGRNRVHVYEENDREMLERQGQMQWVQKIHDVLEQNRFRLFFQDIEHLGRQPNEKSKIHGEVLLRILDEDMKLIGPGSFIPSAERYNMMPMIDRWVVENTLKLLSGNLETVINVMDRCCINLSGQSLSDERFKKFLIEEIKNTRVPPQLLCFEITETAVIANLHTATSLISSLRDMGCRFALDDFGVGLSSFGYLRNLPVDYLKMDGSFVKNMVNDKTDYEMVRAINQIGHTMNIMTIAEFVEDEAILQAVRELGVDYAQGYIIAKPLPMEIALFSDRATASPGGALSTDLSASIGGTGS